MENVGMKIFNKKTVLVTGGCGFIGSWLVKDLLDSGAKTVVFDLKTSSPILNSLKKRPVFVKGDVRRIGLVKKAIQDHKIDFIFHLAAQTIVGVANKDPLPTLETNIMGTSNILEVSRMSPKVKGIVVASSDKAYGDQPVLPYTENTSLRGLHPYDASKSSADLLSQMYFKTYNLPVCIVRSANVFGGGDLHFSRIVPDTINSILLGKNPVIRSDGKMSRDYLYVKDKVLALLTLAGALLTDKKIAGEAFNFGTNDPKKVSEVVDVILKLTGKTGLTPVILNQVKHEIENQYLDSAKANKLLDWRPKYSFEQGLEETIQWYTQYSKTKKS